MPFGSWEPVTYRCEGCGNSYDTEVYGGLANRELAAAVCGECGSRFRLVSDRNNQEEP